MSENELRAKYESEPELAAIIPYEMWLEAVIREQQRKLDTIKEIVGRTATSSNPRDYIASNHELFTMLWGQHLADTRAPQNGGGE